MSELNLKEIYYNLFCKDCKHCLTEESEEPCCDCLTVPVREGSHKPANWEAEK